MLIIKNKKYDKHGNISKLNINFLEGATFIFHSLLSLYVQYFPYSVFHFGKLSVYICLLIMFLRSSSNFRLKFVFQLKDANYRTLGTIHSILFKLKYTITCKVYAALLSFRDMLTMTLYRTTIRHKC